MPDTPAATDTFTAHERTVGDYYGTDYAALWVDLPDDHPVTLVHDSETDLCCALAHAPGQNAHMAMLETRFKLAQYIAEHRRPAAA